MPLRIQGICSIQGLLTALILLGLTVSSVHGAIVIQPSNTIVYQGDKTYLYCQFSVPPKSSGSPCVWTRSGTYITMNEFSGIYDWIGDYQKGNCSFQITGADINRDDAQWICQLPATKDQGDGEKSNPAKLSVYKTPTAPTVTYDNDMNISTNTNLTSNINETHKFVCESRSGNPAPQLTWTFANLNLKASQEKIEVEENGKTYKKTSEMDMEFTKDDDGKVLRCLWNHVTMNETSLFVDMRISVEYVTTKVENLSPNYVIVDEGSGYQFKCMADGNPPSKYEWLYKKEDAENWEIKSYTFDYNIESASYTNEGQYMCLAGNKGMTPSKVTNFQIRSSTRNTVAIVGGIFGALLIIAIIVLAIVVWRLRKRLKEEAAEPLPDIETLNRATSESRPKPRIYGPRDTYMMPIPSEMAPLNPPLYLEAPYNPSLPPRPFQLRAKSGSWKRDPESHIYAEPHFYDTIDGHENDQSLEVDSDLTPTDGPPILPSAPSSPNTTDDGTYLNVTHDDDPKDKESFA